MDLGICPRCGTEWTVGKEICEHCGYVPIGAGLKAMPKPEPAVVSKGRVRILQQRYYHDPFSSLGFLLVLIALFWMAAMAEFQPWDGDWLMVRSWFGEEPSRTVVGNWAVQGATYLDSSGMPAEIDDDLVGVIDFGDDMRVHLTFGRGRIGMEAAGDYEQHGRAVVLRNMRTLNDVPTKLPSTIHMTLTWENDLKMLALVENEEIIQFKRIRQ